MATELAALLRAGRSLDALRACVRERLRAGASLVEVARDVAGEATLSDDDWLELGIAPDVLAAFAARTDARSYTASACEPGLVLLAEHAHSPVSALRMQLPGAPRSVSVGLKVLRDVLRAVEPGCEVTILLRPGANAAAMHRLCARWGVTALDRIRFVSHPSANLFAQDNAKTALVAGERVLLLPRDDGLHRERNRLRVEGLSDAIGLRVVCSRLYWDGGNVLFDGRHVLVGANSVALNALTLGLRVEQVVESFACELGAPVLVLGDPQLAARYMRAERALTRNRVEAGQADFHIDLDVCPLGAHDGGPPRVALADVDLGLAQLEAVCAHAALLRDHFLPAADMAAVLRQNVARGVERRRARLADYRATLEAAGYGIVRVPDVRVAPSDSYVDRINVQLNYVNALPCRTMHGPSVLLWHYGIEAMDAAADAAYRAAGVEPILLGEHSTAHDILHLMGGPHCLLSKLA